VGSGLGSQLPNRGAGSRWGALLPGFGLTPGSAPRSGARAPRSGTPLPTGELAPPHRGAGSPQPGSASMALLAGELAPPGARLVEVRSGVSVVEVDGPWSSRGAKPPSARVPTPRGWGARSRDRGASSPVPGSQLPTGELAPRSRSPAPKLPPGLACTRPAGFIPSSDLMTLRNSPAIFRTPRVPTGNKSGWASTRAQPELPGSP